MKFSTFVFSILSAAACALADNTDQATKATELLEGLQKAPTRAARLSVLKDSEDVSVSCHSPRPSKSYALVQWVFDFTSNFSTTKSAGGNLTVATVASFPALFGNGIAMAIAQME